MPPPFIDWSLAPTIAPWARHLRSLSDPVGLADAWVNPPAQFQRGAPLIDRLLWPRFFLSHAGFLDADFLTPLLPTFQIEDWEALKPNYASLTPDAWTAVYRFVLERSTHCHLPKATLELNIVDWLIDHDKLSGTEPEVRKVLAVILDPEPDGSPSLLAISCYPLLQRLAVLPELPQDLVQSLSSTTEYLVAPRGPKKHPLLEPTIDLRLGLLDHPDFTENMVLALLQHASDPAIFTAVASTKRWGQNRSVQQAILMLDRVSIELLEPTVVAITRSANPQDLVELFTDMALALSMQGKDPLPLMRLFVRALLPEQAALLTKKDLAWFLKNPDREVRAATTALFKHLSPKTKPDKSASQDNPQVDLLDQLDRAPVNPS